ncbi:MAG: glycosyltransferase [Candidatus Microsaccharimonas sp.]
MINPLPKVTYIVLATEKNKSQTEKTVDSILSQKYLNIQTIIIGNYKHRFDKLIHKYKSSKIQYHHSPHDDVAEDASYGVQYAIGEYVAWIRSGEVLQSFATSRIVRTSRKDRNRLSIGVAVHSSNTDNNHQPAKSDHSIESLILRGAINSSFVFCNRDQALELSKKVSALLFSYGVVGYAVAEKRNIHVVDGIMVSKRNVVQEDTEGERLGEFDALVLTLLKTISVERMEEIEGSEYNFLIQSRIHFKSSDLERTKEYLARKIRRIELDTVNSIQQQKAKVTVITPLYNNKHYMVETMKSIDAQTYSDFVYIILDDGSHDNSGKIVANFIKDKPNFFYLYHENVGEAETVNIGWKICNSEYFTQINSDDTAMPNLLEEMVAGLDKNKKHVIGYSGFHIINANGKIIESVLNEKFDLLSDLPKFNCYAATPGAFIRKSAFKNRAKIKDSSYKYINDIKMLWDMALEGEFLYIPQYLGAWRSHAGGISADRYKSADEVVRWLDEFFAKKDMPAKVKELESVTRTGIYKYLAHLMETSNAPDKVSRATYFKQKAALPMPNYSNLQVGDNDLIGNKFNGHDLHINLRKLDVDSSHLVWNKESNDPNTYIIAGQDNDRDYYRNASTLLRSRYKLDYINNHVMYEVVYNKLFLDADIAHFHLMHNGLLDFSVLPLASRLKPIVWTIHDSWIVGGDPIEGDDEGYFFSDEIKDMAVSYDLKKDALEKSDITYIANSNYTKTMLEKSAMFKGKKIHYIPFGIDLNTFTKKDKIKTRKKYKVKSSDIVLMARGSGGSRKGSDYVKYAVERLANEYDNIHLIVVGSAGDLDDLAKIVKVTTYGWIKDDNLLSDLYSLSDLFLMPSRREYFGMMAVEAMACGTLPIVIDGTSLPDAVDAPIHGVSTERDMHKYYEAVKYYIDNTTERENRAALSVEYVKKNHDKTDYTKAIDDLYRQTIADFSISQADSDLLQRMKKHYQIDPISRMVVIDKNAAAKARRLLGKTVRSVRRDGAYITSRKIAKKVYKKTESILRKR